MNKTTLGTYLEMVRVVKLVTDTKKIVSHFFQKKNKDLSLRLFCDIDWAGDSEKRISVTGFIVCVMNVPVY
jgi:hypothetical protein